MRFKDIDIDLPKFAVWKYSDRELRFFLKNSRKHSRINYILRDYPDDTKFRLDDEPVFRFSIDRGDYRHRREILALIGIGSNVFELID